MPIDPRTDHDLIAAVNAGDADSAAAFEALYLRHRDWVAGLALRFTHDREIALDVTQETFLYFLKKFPGFVLTANLKTFLYPAVKHLSIAARQKSMRFSTDADVPAAHDPVSMQIGPDTRRGELARVMSLLDAGHREVVLLRFVDGLSLQEIAAAMGLPLGTVKSRLHHALAALRDNPRTKNYLEP